MSNRDRVVTVDYGNSKQFKRVEPAHFIGPRKVKSVRLERESNDAEFKRLYAEGDTFLITNPEPFKSGTEQSNIDGIFSRKYGPDPMKSDTHEYSCECGYLYGGVNEGKVCTICNHKVEYMIPDTTKRAFIDLAPYHILTFHGYYHFKKFFGPSEFDNIMKATKRIDVAGNVIKEDKTTILTLYEDYDELYADKISIPKNEMFTTKFSTFHPSLRPWFKRDNTVTMFEVNKDYLAIVNIMRDLKMSAFIQSEPYILRNLNALHKHFFAIYEYILDKAKSKDGIFKTLIMSGRVDYSSRMLIIAGTKLKPHQVILPYNTVMEVFEEEIIEMLTKLEDITVAEAMEKHARALNVLDKKFVSVINLFLKNREVWVLIDRNPTIKHGSILYMQVAGIHTDIENKTMAVPLDVIVAQAADFDGDQETAIAQKLVVDSPYSYHEIFKRTFCPTYMFIDGATGYFNNDFSFKKDQISILSEMWNLSQACCEFLSEPDMDTPNNRKIRNIIMDDDMNTSDYEEMVERITFMNSGEDNIVYSRLN